MSGSNPANIVDALKVRRGEVKVDNAVDVFEVDEDAGEEGEEEGGEAEGEGGTETGGDGGAPAPAPA